MVPERMVIEPAFNFHDLYEPYRPSVLIGSKVFHFIPRVLKNGTKRLNNLSFSLIEYWIEYQNHG